MKKGFAMPSKKQKVLFECSIIEIVLLRMLRRSQYGEYTIEVREGEPQRVLGHVSHLLNDEMIENEFSGNEAEITRILSELKLDVKTNGI